MKNIFEISSEDEKNRILELHSNQRNNFGTRVLSEQLRVPSTTIIQYGERGDKVIELQKKLVAIIKKLNLPITLGNSGPSKDGVDGVFGKRTLRVIQEIQKKYGIPPTGEYNLETERIINELNLSAIYSPFGGGYDKQITQKSKNNANTPINKKELPQKNKSVSREGKEKILAKCETGTEKVLNPEPSLLFDGDELHWIVAGQTIKSWKATSGLTFKNTPISDYDKLIKRYTQNREVWAQDKDAGPIPEGQYSIGPLETRSGNLEEISELKAIWYKATFQIEDETDENKKFCKNTILSRISWGNYRLSIKPTGGQNMYKRGSFYVHGGSFAGSHGCIDLTDQMENFAKFFGIWSGSSGKSTISMIVKYKNPTINRYIQKLVNLF